MMRLKESAKKCMACGVLVLMATALISCSHQSKPLLTINGREIFEKEYEAVMQQNVAQTVQHFQTVYGAQYTENFWESEYQKESPAEYLSQVTIQELTQYVVQENLLAEYNLLPFHTYDDFLKQWKLENARREEAVQAGKVIYGPVSYEEREYYQYLLTNGLEELKRIYVQKGVIQQDEEALRKFLQNHPEIVSQPIDTIRLNALSCPYVSDDGTLTMNSRERAYKAAEEARDLLQENLVSMERIPEFVQQAEYCDLTFNDETARTDSLLTPQVFQWAQSAEKNDISDILEDNGAYWIVRLSCREAAAQKPFEEIEDYVSVKYIEAEFNRVFQQALDRVQVHVDADALPVPQI